MLFYLLFMEVRYIQMQTYMNTLQTFHLHRKYYLIKQTDKQTTNCL